MAGIGNEYIPWSQAKLLLPIAEEHFRLKQRSQEWFDTHYKYYVERFNNIYNPSGCEITICILSFEVISDYGYGILS